MARSGSRRLRGCSKAAASAPHRYGRGSGDQRNGARKERRRSTGSVSVDMENPWDPVPGGLASGAETKVARKGLRRAARCEHADQRRASDWRGCFARAAGDGLMPMASKRRARLGHAFLSRQRRVARPFGWFAQNARGFMPRWSAFHATRLTPRRNAGSTQDASRLESIDRTSG